MRKTGWIAGLICCALLAGCGSSGISQAQYESVAAERDAYKAQLESLAKETTAQVTTAQATTVQAAATESKQADKAVSSGTKAEKTAAPDLQEITLKDSGWTSSKSSDYTRISYAVKIDNPNKEYAVMFPKIIITAKDAAGKILKNEEQTLNSMAGGDTISYADSITYEGEEPATVDISVSSKKNNFKKQDDKKYAHTADLVISNTAENAGTFKTFTGEIENKSSIDFNTVAVSVVFKSGEKLTGGATAYVDDLGAGESKAFEISPFSNADEYDSYEISAIQW